MMNLKKLMMIALILFNTNPIAVAQEIDIFAAARAGKVSDINIYVQQGGDVNISNAKTYTPFILAAYYGHIDAAETLLKLGAKACALDTKGNNAFMGVAFKGHQQFAKWLLENTSCQVNHQNYAGQTALMMAALFGRESIIKLLLQHGADPLLTDAQGNSATTLAQAQGLSRVVEIIKFYLQ